MGKIRGIILAAGRGKRMGHLTDDKPKCLNKIGETSLLEIQLRSMRLAGISEIALVTGYRADLLQGITDVVFHNEKWKISNMVASLRLASAWLSSSVCVVSYSDIFFESEAIRILVESRDDLSITFDPNWYKLWAQRFENPLEDAETFLADSSGYLTDIGSPPNSLEQVQGQYMGLLKFTPRSWAFSEQIINSLDLNEARTLQMTRLLQMLIANESTPIRALPYFGLWGEVDNPDDLEIAQRLWLATDTTLET